MSEDLNQKLGLLIRCIRVQKGIDLKDFAAQCGLTLRRAKKVEAGLAKLKLSDLTRFARCLGVSVCDLQLLVESDC